MKVLNKIVMGAAALVLLTACGPSKCSFEKFQQEAKAAEAKDPKYTKMTAKGKVIADVLGATTTIDVNHSYELQESGEWKKTEGKDGLADAVVLVMCQVRAWDMAEEEQEDVTYYVGGGFKVVVKDDKGNDATVTFNKDGYVTSTKGKDAASSSDLDLKFTWKK